MDRSATRHSRCRARTSTARSRALWSTACRSTATSSGERRERSTAGRCTFTTRPATGWRSTIRTRRSGRRTCATERRPVRFGAHYLPTYVPSLDGPTPDFYSRMFEQMQLLDQLGYDDVWVTEHHFDEYGGTIPDPPVFLSAVARTLSRLHLGVSGRVLPLRNPLQIAE